MSLILPSASEATMMKFALGVITPGNQRLKLFVNNYVPDDTTIVANLTEMSTNGYADKPLTTTSWVVTAGATGQPASAAYATQTWTFTNVGGSNTVYGYHITDTTTGLLLWVESFAAAKIVANNGDQIIITPTITNSRT